MRIALVSVGLALGVACSTAFAQLKDEVLWAKTPAGYKLDYRENNNDTAITEFVPVRQSVKNWTEMMTIQIFYRLKVSPEQFMAKTEQLAPQACPGATVARIRQGEENGYNFILFLQHCPLNKATGKPEITWFKAIEGNYSFYVVQFATKAEPPKEKITGWMQYLRSVVVCDTRLPDRACEAGSGGRQ